MHKIFQSILILLASAVIQFFLGSFGLTCNVMFGTLVAFAFLFSWSELIIFDLIAILIIHCWSGLEWATLMQALLPVVVGFLKSIFPWQPWVCVPIVAAIGSVILVVISGAWGVVGLSLILFNILINSVWALGTYGMLTHEEID